jgi:hypothetical protein
MQQQQLLLLPPVLAALLQAPRVDGQPHLPHVPHPYRHHCHLAAAAAAVTAALPAHLSQAPCHQFGTLPLPQQLLVLLLPQPHCHL